LMHAEQRAAIAMLPTYTGAMEQRLCTCLQVCFPQLFKLILIQKLLHALLHRRARAAAGPELPRLPALLGADCGDLGLC